MGVFRLKGQSKRDGSIIVRSRKASQSPVYPTRDAFAVVEHPSCPCWAGITGEGSSQECTPDRDRGTRLATSRWHDSLVQFRAYLPSLTHCSAVPSTIVEPYHSFGASRHVRDDESPPRVRLAPMPLHLGHDPPSTAPTLSTIPKVVVLGSLAASAASPQVVSARERCPIPRRERSVPFPLRRAVADTLSVVPSGVSWLEV